MVTTESTNCSFMYFIPWLFKLLFDMEFIPTPINYIKGGRVDYGQAHAEKYGHDRYGRTYTGVMPECNCSFMYFIPWLFKLLFDMEFIPTPIIRVKNRSIFTYMLKK
jgi:hypothetical protein